MLDPDIVLNFIDKMGSNSNLTFKDLTLKSIALLALACQQWFQTIVLLLRHEYIQERE